jgi:hypothetical protein
MDGCVKINMVHLAVTPYFKDKIKCAHSMCAHDQVFTHTNSKVITK